MKHGFVKVAAVTPDILVADCWHNRDEIIDKMMEAAGKGAKIIVFPELCITGYTCSDLFWQEQLLMDAKSALQDIVKSSEQVDALVFVGLPMEYNNKLYNVAAAFSKGELLGIVPKTYLPNYAEFYEARHFTAGFPVAEICEMNGKMVPFGTDILFKCTSVLGLVVGAEICEDLWTPCPPSIRHAMAGATVLVNLSASDETTGKDVYRRELVNGQSARLICGYIYASAGEGESTTDLVFGGHNLIAENGTMLTESERFHNQIIYGEIDVNRLRSERRRMTTFEQGGQNWYTWVNFTLEVEDTVLSRPFFQTPFVPGGKKDRDKRCEEILTIQSLGLKKRLAHTHAGSAVIGLSGGLDSTLALLVTVRAFDSLNLPRKQIIAVTMPCFGTTDRTYRNAISLAESLKITIKEVPIADAVIQHFKDIEQDMNCHDITYENGQARERTQVLMDIANKNNGLVIGTGDMSELALGWATYNGDHMSMYGVNCSIPKTLVRHLTAYYADICEDETLRAVLLDVLDTPVSPELLPPKEGEIAQKTEDIVGPYELHDFYLYYMLRFGFPPAKIYRIAKVAFAGKYEDETILKWLRTFYRRFFAQQFKRSCLPDGPKVGSIAVSPRGDLRMPSDACMTVWQRELDRL